MSEAKPFASLSSGLLARKGAAKPAMRPQGFGQGAAGLEDLGWNDMGFEAPRAAILPRDEEHDAFGHEVVELPRTHGTGLTPIQSPVHTQQAEIADRFSADELDEEADETATTFEAEAPVLTIVAEPVEEAPVRLDPPSPAPAPIAVVKPAPVAIPRRTPRPRSAPGSKAKAAFTLRLDPERHLKLRLACAVDGRSAQQVVTDALDHLLGSMPELEAMAEKAKRKG